MAANLTAMATVETTATPSSAKPSVWLVALMDSWGILTAVILIYLMVTRKELHYSSYHWLILNAVIVCLIACCLVTPAIIYQDLAKHTLPIGFCFLYGVLVWVVQLMVPLTLLMVLLDRIVYICDPIVYARKMGSCMLIMMMLLPWMLALVFAVCSFVPFDGELQQRALMDELDGCKYCIMRLGFEFMESHAKFIVTCYYALPIILLVVAMFIMTFVLAYRRHCCISHLDEFDFEFEDIREGICHAAVPISLIIFIYLSLLLPSLAIIFRGIEMGEELAAMETAMWVFVSFEWIQPFLWIILVADIRHAFCRAFCCCCIEESTDSADEFKFEKAEKPTWR